MIRQLLHGGALHLPLLKLQWAQGVKDIISDIFHPTVISKKEVVQPQDETVVKDLPLCVHSTLHHAA